MHSTILQNKKYCPFLGTICWFFFGWSIFIHSFVKCWRYAWKKCKVQFLNIFDSTTTTSVFLYYYNIQFIYNQVFDLVYAGSNHNLFTRLELCIEHLSLRGSFFLYLKSWYQKKIAFICHETVGLIQS